MTDLDYCDDLSGLSQEVLTRKARGLYFESRTLQRVIDWASKRKLAFSSRDGDGLVTNEELAIARLLTKKRFAEKTMHIEEPML